MKVTAKLKDASLSAQKGRLIVDMVRSMEVAKAIEILKFTPKKGAEIVLKVLQSAIANAENNNGADIDALVIYQIKVDEAASLKRISPRAKGRANHIIKRRSHITVTVSEKE